VADLNRDSCVEQKKKKKTRLGHLALRDLMESRLTARTTKKYQHTTLYDICYFQTLDLRRESDNEF